MAKNKKSKKTHSCNNDVNKTINNSFNDESQNCSNNMNGCNLNKSNI